MGLHHHITILLLGLLIGGVAGGVAVYQWRRVVEVKERMRGFAYLGHLSQHRPVGADDLRVAFDPYCKQQRDRCLAGWDRAAGESGDGPQTG